MFNIVSLNFMGANDSEQGCINIFFNGNKYIPFNLPNIIFMNIYEHCFIGLTFFSKLV